MTARSALFWVAAVLCVVAELAILRSVLFGRASKAGAATERGGTPPSLAGRYADVAWSVIPAAGLLLVLYLTWRAVEPPRPPAADVSHRGATIGE